VIAAPVLAPLAALLKNPATAPLPANPVAAPVV
jgi:hypothetical protein